MNELIKYRIECAKEEAENSRFCLNHKLYRSASNRIYYSYYYIVNALALKDKVDIKKHKQLITWFLLNYIKTQVFSVDLGHYYKNDFLACKESDYGEFIFQKKEELEIRYEHMIEFITKIEELITK